MLNVPSTNSKAFEASSVKVRLLPELSSQRMPSHPLPLKVYVLVKLFVSSQTFQSPLAIVLDESRPKSGTGQSTRVVTSAVSLNEQVQQSTPSTVTEFVQLWPQSSQIESVPWAGIVNWMVSVNTPLPGRVAWEMFQTIVLATVSTVAPAGVKLGVHLPG